MISSSDLAPREVDANVQQFWDEANKMLNDRHLRAFASVARGITSPISLADLGSFGLARPCHSLFLCRWNGAQQKSPRTCVRGHEEQRAPTYYVPVARLRARACSAYDAIVRFRWTFGS